jgi:hypothetical protein
MKFGKLLREQQGGWILLDYKRLKHLLKESPQTFAEELWGSIATVNAGFLEGERTLVAQLSVQTAGERDCSEFLDEVRQLYRSTVLNYIACLKIVKKHDKVRQDGVQPLRPQVRPWPAPCRVCGSSADSGPPLWQMLEYLFSQAFVASLEHSYLFEECWRFLHSRPLCSGCIDSGLAESISKDFDQMRRLTPSSVTELEIERMLGASPGSAERYFPKTQRPGTMTSSSPLTGARNGSLPCGTGGFRLDAEEQSCNMPISLSSPGRRSQLLVCAARAYPQTLQSLARA